MLELGVGTGRLAIPLAERGLQVWGVDASAAMLDRLAAKPGGALVTGVQGDLASMRLPAGAPAFGLAFAAFNTLCMLPDEGSQRSCLELVASAVAPGAHLVLEVFVPPIAVAPRGVVEITDLASDCLVLRAFRRGTDSDTFEGHHVEITDAGGVRLRPWRIRAPRPMALDELAANAGWQLVDRLGGWQGEPFTEASWRHVSTYERA